MQALRVERTLNAAPEEVFDAWIDPVVLRRWWTTDPRWEAAAVEVDAREGGSYRLSMRDPEASATHTVRGTYSVIERPRRLVYTWAWEERDGSLGPQSTVTVEFAPAASGTRVLILHEGLPAGDSAARHEQGWNGVLDSLTRILHTND